MNCRFCHAVLSDVFLDLGTAPPSNAFLSDDELKRAEAWFPLKLFTCSECKLVQVDEVQDHARLFSPDYVYFSSYSRSWLEHARRFVDVVVPRLQLDAHSHVVEVASNDGYLLQYFAERGIPCLGIEPTEGTARAAREKGIESLVKFFGEPLGRELAQAGRSADLVVGNNVLAHVPDINDFVAGIRELLAPGGVATLEFPHLLEMVQNNQFDTVYHEHFSYLGFGTVQRVFAAHGLRLWDVECLDTHGGSLRIWACHQSDPRANTEAVASMLARESAAGMGQMPWYRGFQAIAEKVKDELLSFLIEQKRAGLSVAAYGAAAKGNTLFNFAGVREDLVAYVVDASPHKQGRFLPGSRIPVRDEAHLKRTQPDVVLILPWNLREEIAQQLEYVSRWGGRLVVAVPRLEVLSA